MKGRPPKGKRKPRQPNGIAKFMRQSYKSKVIPSSKKHNRESRGKWRDDIDKELDKE